MIKTWPTTMCESLPTGHGWADGRTFIFSGAGLPTFGKLRKENSKIGGCDGCEIHHKEAGGDGTIDLQVVCHRFKGICVQQFFQ